MASAEEQAIEALAERLRPLLKGSLRTELSYQSMRRIVANRDTNTDTITAALRLIGWLPSLMKRANGSPRYWYQDAPNTLDVQGRILRRAKRLRAGHQRTDLPVSELVAELATLGPYILGEKRAVSLRRAAIKRVLPNKRRGKFEMKEPLPTDPADIESELASLGPWAWRESAYISRRRAALQRLLGSYCGKWRAR